MREGMFELVEAVDGIDERCGAGFVEEGEDAVPSGAGFGGRVSADHDAADSEAAEE